MENNNENNPIRLLRADEIECRVAMANGNGVSLLLYKDARVDQRILDEAFGIFGWKRSHQYIGGSLYCTVEVYNKETGEWIAKQDVGSNGEQQKEKSQASDSFKRACFNWGIGRELYSAPFIWVPAGKVTIQKKGDKYFCNEHFSVSSITYNRGREITGLVILDSKNQTVYEMKQKASEKAEARKAGSKKPEETKGSSRTVSVEQMNSLAEELVRTGVGVEQVKERYQIDSMETMSGEVYRKVMNALAKTKSKAA